MEKKQNGDCIGKGEEMIEEEKECPWCGELLSLAESNHQGSHGKMRIMRCGKCHRLISVRLEREPDRIIKKELVEGGSL